MAGLPFKHVIELSVVVGIVMVKTNINNLLLNQGVPNILLLIGPTQVGVRTVLAFKMHLVCMRVGTNGWNGMGMGRPITVGSTFTMLLLTHILNSLVTTTFVTHVVVIVLMVCLIV
jgi:hypothetical protein